MEKLYFEVGKTEQGYEIWTHTQGMGVNRTSRKDTVDGVTTRIGEMIEEYLESPFATQMDSTLPMKVKGE